MVIGESENGFVELRYSRDEVKGKYQMWEGAKTLGWFPSIEAAKIYWFRLCADRNAAKIGYSKGRTR